MTHVQMNGEDYVLELCVVAVKFVARYYKCLTKKNTVCKDNAYDFFEALGQMALAGEMALAKP